MAAIDRRVPLSHPECLQLLGRVLYGRVVFTAGALPAVRLASHLVDGGQIIICASLGTAVSPGPDGSGPVVAYEADQVNADEWSGWNVVVVGRAALVTDEQLAARYRALLRPAWADEQASQVITITAELVTGYLVNGKAPTAAGPPILAG